MTRYIVGRLAQGVLVVVGASVITFAMVFVAGDPTAAFAQPDWTQEQVEAFRRDQGFDRPWIVQYARFLSGAVRGQFGNSLRYHQPVFALLLERLPATFELAGLALLLSTALGVPLGVLAAVRRDSLGDQFGMGLALVGQAFPTFWLGIMLILVFAVELRWVPISGRGTPAHAVLPALTLATYGLARNARLVRSSLLSCPTCGGLWIGSARTHFRSGVPHPMPMVRLGRHCRCGIVG